MEVKFTISVNADENDIVATCNSTIFDDDGHTPEDRLAPLPRGDSYG